MPVLKNAKHELFAQELAKGRTATEAYASAGYKPDDGNASKLAARPDVQARVQEITGAAAERAGVTVEQVIRELSKLAFANMLDFIRIGPDGLPYTDFSALTREQAAAIGEIIVETRRDLTAPATDEELEPQGHGGALKRERASDVPGPDIVKVRFKLADKRGPLTDLARHLGMFKDKVEHSGEGGGPIKIERIERVIIDAANRDG